MTDRDLQDLRAHISALLTVVVHFRDEMSVRIGSLEQQVKAMRTVTSRTKTWTEWLKLAVAVKMASPHFWATLTFLSSTIGRTLRGWLGW